LEEINELMAAHGAGDVRVLGSGASGEIGLVFLVEMEAGRNLLDLVALTEDMREALGPEIEVLTEGSISPYLRARVLAEAMTFPS
jgi:hypothetical protein